MTTSQATPFLSEILSDGPIPEGKLAYFRARFRNRVYDHILSNFLRQEMKGLTRATLARRIGRAPEIITRILGAPGNWTLDTVSDLMLGISAAELEFQDLPLKGRPPRNYRGETWGSADRHFRLVANKTLSLTGTAATTEPAITAFKISSPHE